MSNNSRLKDLLTRFSQGQVTLQDEICAELSNSTVFVLLSEPIADSPTGAAVIKVALSNEGGKQIATMFLDFETGTTWCEKNGVPPNFAEMNGADVCVALPQGTAAKIDPDTFNSTLLSSVLVIKIASFGYDAVSKSQTGKPDQNVPEASVVGPDTGSFQLASTTPSKPRYIPRGHPTTFSMSPISPKKPEEKLNTGRARTYTSSNLKKIIRPPGSSS